MFHYIFNKTEMDRISVLEKEIEELRKTLNDRETELYLLKKLHLTNTPASERPDVVINNTLNEDKLPRWAIERYCRQILVPEIGVAGQSRICQSKVLIVGAGGLGCPAGAYLAGAGVGEIGIVDYDTVEITNVHRQIFHSEQDRYLNKVDSLADSLRRLNSTIKVTTYNVQLNSNNALEIISKYDIVLDCTDNIPTRYLVNDACVLVKVPLISASALKMEGQLTIYGYREDKFNDKNTSNPCYRCVFPVPANAETVGSCSTSGIVGPITGTIGSLQALEAIKLIAGSSSKNLLVGRMLLFDGADCVFRVVKLRNRNVDCASCSDNPSITKLIDYEGFCKTKAKEENPNLHILSPTNRISVEELSRIINSDERHLLVDVRSEYEFQMCKIDGAVNYPIDKLGSGAKFEQLIRDLTDYNKAIFICRKGNNSQIVAQKVLERILEKNKIKDVTGGLYEWSKLIDHQFPLY